MKSKRKSTIEILRLIFSIIVVIYHSQLCFGEVMLGSSGKFCLMGRGSFSVEFFFLVTGLLMAKHVDGRQRTESLGKDCFHYMKKKYMSVFPYMLLCFTAGVIFNAITDWIDLETFTTSLFRSLPNLFMLQMSGIPADPTVVSYTWYLSAMMLSMLILYPLLRRNYDNFIYILAPIITIFTIGNMVKNTYTLTGIWFWTGTFYKGFLRALAEISLGCICYEVSKKLKSTAKTLPKTILITITEIISYAIVFVYICTTYKDTYHLYMLPVLALAVTLTFSGTGALTALIDKKLTIKYLGKLSLCIYVCQSLAQKIVSIYLDKLALETKIAVHVGLTLVIAVIFMLLIDTIRKINSHIKSREG